MPNPTFYQPIEAVLEGKCKYTYYDYVDERFSEEKKSRICKMNLSTGDNYNDDVVMMIFTIRNQNGDWKIHSEGAQRLGGGDTVPLRNTAVKLAKDNNWKYIAAAVIPENAPDDDLLKQYIVAIESYYYGDNTVYNLADEIKELENRGLPDFYRTNIMVNDKQYSLAFVKKDKFIDYIKFFDDRPYQYKHRDIQDNESKQKDTGSNKIYYGVPGSGKSHKINDLIDKSKYIRTVFHPDYSYSDFVGQLLPKRDDTGRLDYRFVEGPFVKALKLANAEENKDKMVYLVIEEINRGNAPAIFGDIFQLLDRKDDGESEYSITNDEIAEQLYGKERTTDEIRIPSNLSIYATMNTADQNVFTLDTAFQRRWDMEYVENDFEAKDNEEHVSKLIGNSKVTWKDFASTINKTLLSHKDTLLGSEDKLLGVYFAQDKEITDTSGVAFANKVLKYLWDDAAKMERTVLFNKEIASIEELLKIYKDAAGVETQGRESNQSNDKQFKSYPLSRVMSKEVYEQMTGEDLNPAKYETYESKSDAEETE